MMFYFASNHYVTSLREGRRRAKDCSLFRWLDCRRKKYLAVGESFLTKFSDEIIPDSLKGDICHQQNRKILLCPAVGHTVLLHTLC